MQWEEPTENSRITKLSYRLQDGECILTWQWPKLVESVYIDSFEEGTELLTEQLALERLKLFTREEYKAKSGYHERIDYIGPHGYRIYPCAMVDGKLRALRQRDENNRVRVSGERAKIRYALKYGNRWFGRYKTLRMELFCEIPVPKEALCYVKKEGAPPRNKDDGMAYPFISDFAAGPNVLQEIEVGKNDYVRLFFTDGMHYGSMFELIPM